MRKAPRRLLRQAIVLGGLIGLPVLLSYATPLHRFLIGIAGNAAGVKIHFEKSRIFLLFGEARLGDLTVTGEDDRPLLRASRLRLSLSPLSLLRGKLLVSHLDFDQPTLFLKKQVPAPKPAPEVFRKFFSFYENSLLLQNLIIRRARFSALTVEPPDGKPFEVQEVRIKLEPTLLREIKGHLELKTLKRQKVLIDRLNLDLIVAENATEISRLELFKDEAVLRLHGKMQGNLEKGSLKGSGEFFPQTVLDQPLRFQIESQFSKKTAQISKIAAQLGQAEFQGQGILKTDTGDYHLDFRASQLPLESIFHKLPGPLLANSRGMGELEGEAQGKLPALSAKARATIRDFRHRSLAAAQAKGEIQLNWPDLDFWAQIQSAAGGPEDGRVDGGVVFKPLTAGGELKTFPKKISLQMEGASLRSILPELKVSGLLTGRLDMTGEGTSVAGKGVASVHDGSIGPIPVDSLETEVALTPDGLVSFHKTTLSVARLETILLPEAIRVETAGETVRFGGHPSPQLRFAGTYDPRLGHWNLQEIKIRSDAGDLTINGTVQEALHLNVRGPFNLSSLRLFRALVDEGEGFGQLDLAVGGTWEDPELNGKIELKDAALELHDLGDSLTDLQGGIRLEGRRLFPKISGRFGDGKFSLEGNLQTTRFQPEEVDLHLLGFGLPIRRKGELSLEVNADVTLKGKWPSPLLAGSVDIIEGRYTRKFEIHEFVLKPVASKKPSALEKSRWNSVALALSIKSSGDLEIKSNVASLFLACDLDLRGTYEDPKIKGAFTLVEGTFDYFGNVSQQAQNAFVLTEGRMEFTDPYRQEPYLSLKGEQEIPPDYLVSLKLEGYLNNLQITLSSSPPREREDVLSLIAFGVTRDEIERTGSLGSQLGQRIAWQEAMRPFEGVVSRTLGLDVQLEPSSADAFSPSRFAVGREVTDRLSFELKTDFSPETAERTVQANYYLTDNVLLKGFRTRTASTAAHYQFNLSLRFRLR